MLTSGGGQRDLDKGGRLWQARGPVKALLSALFWLYLAVSLMVFWFAVVPVWLVLLPFDRRRRFSHRYAWVWANHYVALSPYWRIHVEGRERIADDRAYVLVANHQSFGDIFVLYQLRKQFKWVAKDSVFWVPFLGWMMWMADYVAIRRGDAVSRRRMLERCLRHLRRGSSVLMFPEGTRSKDGQIREFRRGAFAMAVAAGVPVVPIVIDGTLHALPQGTWVFQQDGVLDIRVRVLEPVHPDSVGGDAQALARAVQAAMVAALAEMRGDRVAPRAVAPQ
jgi:1-acyl-sn-glycerol-3-phosphate acyltransferase